MSLDNKTIAKCVRIAIDEFDKHTADTFTHWSFVVQGRKILDWGCNKLNDPVGLQRFGYKDKRHSLHAEAVALRKAYGLLDRRMPWTMVNIRLGAQKELRMAAPCSVCQSFIAACGCNECYFTIDGTFAKTSL